MRRAAVLVALAMAMAACGSSAPSPSPPPTQPGEEATRFDEFTLPGITLWTVSGSVPDHGWSSVVGIDASGHSVPTATLFARAITPGLPPDTVARRAQQLLGIQGGLLHTGADAGGFGTPEQKALVVPPVVENGTLTMWMTRGEMAPEITRVQVVLATQAVTYDSARSLVQAAPTPEPTPTPTPEPPPPPPPGPPPAPPS